MREIDVTEECLEFIDTQDERVSLKFFQLLEVFGEVKVVHTNFLKKLQGTQFYEMRIKAGNEFRVVIFAIDHLNFAECTKAVCLYGFQKKSTKDYKTAVKKAEKILEKYLKEK
jgi:uncharacterized protein YihD (DUF1040 family)